MKRRAYITALCVAVGVLAPRVTVASDTAPVVVVYRAPSECPNAESFRLQLQRRLPSNATVELLAPNQRTVAHAMVVQVDVEMATGSFLAQLSLRHPDGQSSPRSLTGSRCADLIEALAFTAALSVEQAQEVEHTEPKSGAVPVESTTQGSPQPVATASQAKGEPPLSTATTPATGRQAAPSASEPAQQPEEDTYYDDTSPRTGPGFFTWTAQASGGLTFTSPLNTSLSPGLTVGLQFNAESATGWSPALGLSLQGSLNPLQVTNESASFGFLSGQAYLCPGALRADPWTARLCGVLQIGTIHGRGENLDNTRSISTRMSSAGLVLSTDYFVSSQVFVGGQVGALLALDKNQFEVGIERRVVAETRTIAPWLALAIGTTL